MRQRPTRRARGGFTLIELLVVIAIIAVLVSMMMAGIMKVKDAGKRTQVTDELSQMKAAFTKFQTNFKNPGNPPSMLILCEDHNAYPNTPLGQESKKFLDKCFGQGGSLGPVDWNGNGVIDSGQVLLDGSQCMVFFLSGINGKGFSSNTRNPADFSRPRIDPAFSFKQDRLNTAAPYSPQFPAYNDPYGRPYAFFSSYWKSNGYNRYGTSDCANLGVQPYFTPRHTANIPDYYEPTSFQIISAGKNGIFGPGGLYPPASGQGGDDMASFHQGIMNAQ
jgi:prepilin-type N-terminal cleavage/methylation domain-containing protein